MNVKLPSFQISVTSHEHNLFANVQRLAAALARFDARRLKERQQRTQWTNQGLISSSVTVRSGEHTNPQSVCPGSHTEGQHHRGQTRDISNRMRAPLSSSYSLPRERANYKCQ